MGQFPQTTFREVPDFGLQGQPGDMNPYTANSAILEADMDPGLFLTLGAGGYGFADEIDAAADVTTAGLLQGVGIYRPALEPASPNFAEGDSISVMRRGYVWVLCNGTVTDGGPVYIVFDNTDPTDIRGSIRADAGSGTIAAAAPSGVRVKRGATGKGSLALVELNLI
jgi:hypothetical protein